MRSASPHCVIFLQRLETEKSNEVVVGRASVQLAQVHRGNWTKRIHRILQLPQKEWVLEELPGPMPVKRRSGAPGRARQGGAGGGMRRGGVGSSGRAAGGGGAEAQGLAGRPRFAHMGG
jgi:uncharacterized membrane protein YgcG